MTIFARLFRKRQFRTTMLDQMDECQFRVNDHLIQASFHQHMAEHYSDLYKRHEFSLAAMEAAMAETNSVKEIAAATVAAAKSK